MSFPHSPRNGHPPQAALAEHCPNTPLCVVRCSVKKNRLTVPRSTGEQSSAVPQGRIPAQGLLQPTFKLEPLRAEVACVCCAKSKGFIITFYNKAQCSFNHFGFKWPKFEGREHLPPGLLRCPQQNPRYHGRPSYHCP